MHPPKYQRRKSFLQRKFPQGENATVCMTDCEIDNIEMSSRIGESGLEDALPTDISPSWTNIQEPVRQMISAITKAVRTHSAGIAELDRRIGLLPQEETVFRLIESALRDYCSKRDAADIIKLMDERSDDTSSSLRAIESRLSGVRTRMSK